MGSSNLESPFFFGTGKMGLKNGIEGPFNVAIFFFGFFWSKKL